MVGRLTTLALAILLAACEIAFCQPVITDIEGTWFINDTLTISGSGFGVKNYAPPLLWDAIENIAAYDGLEYGQVIPTGPGYPWRENGSPWTQDVVYGDQDSRVPDRPYYQTQTKGFLRGASYLDLDPPQLYINWWFNSTLTRDEWSLASTKINRLIANEQTSVVEHNDSYLVWWGQAMAIVQGPTTTENDWNFGEFVQNEWQHLEMLCDNRGLSGSMAERGGRVTAWTDGIAVHDTTYGGFHPVSEIYVLGFDPSITAPYADDIFKFGEVYVDTTQARVILANNQILSSATHTEIQIPQTWDPENITFTVNRGNFSDTANLWIFVFDTNGNHQDLGYPVEGQITPGQPGMPTRLVEDNKSTGNL